jgi:hypothetical protein
MMNMKAINNLARVLPVAVTGVTTMTPTKSVQTPGKPDTMPENAG